MPSENKPIDPVDHLLPPAHPPASGGVGPTVGVIIILLLLIAGGVYSWISGTNRPTTDVPLIPADNSEQQ